MRLLALVALLVARAVGTKKPHILFVVVDDLGWNGAKSQHRRVFNWSSNDTQLPSTMIDNEPHENAELLQKYNLSSCCADVGFHGNAGYSTPTIDALAQSGIILDQYYVQARRSIS